MNPKTPQPAAKPTKATKPAPAPAQTPPVEAVAKVVKTPAAKAPRSKPVKTATLAAPSKPAAGKVSTKVVAKSASPAALAKVAKPAKATKASRTSRPEPAKPVKLKLVRDTFTFPEDEYTQLAALKKRVLALGVEAKKGELVRVGLSLLSATSDDALLAAMGKLTRLKTGRPKQ